MDFLIRFSHVYESFRVPELRALALLEGVEMDIISYDPDSPFCIVHLADPASAPRLVRRSILTQSIAELWAQAASLAELHQIIRSDAVMAAMWRDRYAACSFKFRVDSFRANRHQAEVLGLINSFGYLPLGGRIAMRDPDEVFAYCEHWPDGSPESGERRGAPGAEPWRRPGEPTRVFFGRHVGSGARDLIPAYDLKKRRYISTTSMDSELALVTANLGLAGPGKLFYDPFVGTGSFPIACAHFGALVFGSDIDGRTIRGTGRARVGGGAKLEPEPQPEPQPEPTSEPEPEPQPQPQLELESESESKPVTEAGTGPDVKPNGRKSKGGKKAAGPGACIRDNFEQYGLLARLGDMFAADLTNTPIRVPNHDVRLLDGIVCDPPYGVREGLRVLGCRDPLGRPWVMEAAWKHHKESTYIPSKKPYSFVAMLDDILMFAAQTLVDDGRLSFWIPMANDDGGGGDGDGEGEGEGGEVAIPEHPCLEIVSVCTQAFNKWSRRLITYRRLPDRQVDQAKLQAYVPRQSEAGRKADELNKFRKGYFSKFVEKK